MKLIKKIFNQKPDYFKMDQEKIINEILEYENKVFNGMKRIPELDKKEEQHMLFLERRSILVREKYEPNIKADYLRLIPLLRTNY